MTRTCTLLALGTTMLVAAACNDHSASKELTAPIFDRKESAQNGKNEHERHLGASLKGRNEVPPRDTRATGQAFFRLSKDGSSVDYKLIVHDIKNPFMAHIHIGAAGVNGPIVVWLFPSTATTPGPTGVGRRDGLLAKGTFTAANFISILQGHPLSDLLDSIAAGHAYVNVHTDDGVAPPNTGPGDFPGGEIRDQVAPRHEDEDDDDEKDHQGKRIVRMLDDCDPATFNAALMDPNACKGNGKTTFQSFIDELTNTGVAAAWRFFPTKLEAKEGTTLIAKNKGGEVHTFTRVVKFGGGIVDMLNTLSHNPEIAPECKALEDDDFVPPGGRYEEEVNGDDTQLFQCCIHPWMRTTVRRDNHKGHDHDHDDDHGGDKSHGGHGHGG
jgi:CHRD domain